MEGTKQLTTPSVEELRTLGKELLANMPSQEAADVLSDLEVAINESKDAARADERAEALAHVQASFLGIIDNMHDRTLITDAQAQEYYGHLHLSPAQRSRLRGPSA